MKVIVNNLAVEYKEEGTGPVLLFLHGWSQTLHSFDTLTPAFLNNFRVVRLNLPGFGGSELPSESWGIGEYVHFVQDFCHKLQIEPYTLVGHSFGGRIIIKGVSENVFHPKKIVLIASAGIATHKTLRARLFLVISKVGNIGLYFLPRKAREHLRKRFYGIVGSSDYINANNPILKGMFLKAIREDLTDSARLISAPTLLIWGKQDIVTPYSDGKRLHDLISGSKLEVFEESGHFVHQEEQEGTAELMMEFISK